MKIYNLTYDKKYYISTTSIKTFPEDNFCLVECEYTQNNTENNIENNTEIIIQKISGLLKKDGEIRECTMGPLILPSLYKNFKIYIESENIDTDKIYLNYIDTEKNNEINNENNEINNENKCLNSLVILICSYLVYVNFSDLPYHISSDLLNNENLYEYAKMLPNDEIEENFVFQVNLLIKYFGKLFNNNTSITNNIDVYLEKKFKEWNETQDKIINEIIDEIKEYKRKLLLDLSSRQLLIPSIENMKKLSDQILEIKLLFQSIRNFKFT